MHEHVDLLAINIIYNIEHNFFMMCAVLQTYIRSILLEILPDSTFNNLSREFEILTFSVEA